MPNAEPPTPNTMQTETIPHPKIATQAEWFAERKKLLQKEKELTRETDRINAERRRLPMVKLEKRYVFEAPEGNVSVQDLFEGRLQLIIYHFMFDPEWDEGCPDCTGFVNALGDLSMLQERNTTFALISRGPINKLESYKKKMGWNWRWVSSFDSDFNYDFHVTFDESKAPLEYNFESKEEMAKKRDVSNMHGESHGLSVFFRMGDDVFHTYSSYARGVENLTDSYRLLDVTPYGRQEDFEDSPPGWPQKPTYG